VWPPTLAPCLSRSYVSLLEKLLVFRSCADALVRTLGRSHAGAHERKLVAEVAGARARWRLVAAFGRDCRCRNIAAAGIRERNVECFLGYDLARYDLRLGFRELASKATIEGATAGTLMAAWYIKTRAEFFEVLERTIATSREREEWPEDK
jgi:hypothetical protein